MARQVLVTGAYGFIGRHVARHYADAGWRVIGIGHGSWSREDWRRWGVHEWHAEDITPETLTTYGGEPEQIVHCAGGGSVAFSVAHPYQDFQRTTQTTAATLEYARLCTPQSRFVLLSSAAVYGAAVSLPIAESAMLAPVSPYGVHKRASEDLCRSYAAGFGLSIAIVRLFSIYGSGLRKQLLWDACTKLKDGNTDFSGSGEERRDWLHIQDAVTLLEHAGRNASRNCPIVNGGSGRSVSVREIVERLALRFPQAGPVRFSGAARAGDPAHYEADISAARGWGWEPTIALDAGISGYVDWFHAEVA